LKIDFNIILATRVISNNNAISVPYTPDIPLHSGIIMGFHSIPVDSSMLNPLMQFGLDVEHAYYLLLKKHLRSSNKGSTDIA
jgi:hypothetical protein